MGTSRLGVGDAVRRTAVTAGAIAVLLALTTSGARAAGGPNAGATRIGRAPASRRIQLVFPLRADLSGLERFAASVSTPGSALYGQYESIPALAHRFGAAASVRARVLRVLRGAGASGVRIDATGLYADATMTVGLADRLFGAALAQFRTAGAARYIAPGAVPRLPRALRGAVTGVVGLSTRPLAIQHQTTHGSFKVHAARSAFSEQPAAESGYTPATGTPAGCAAAASQGGFTPNQYRTAYGYAPLEQAGTDGQGERVALIEIDGYKQSDLRTFARCFGFNLPKITPVRVDLNHTLAPGGESTLDIEVLDSVAPKLKAIDVYESNPTAVAVLHSLTAPLTNPGRKPDVISASLGACESDTRLAIGNSGLGSVEASLALASASGISVLASSGDDGSSGCVGNNGDLLPGLAVSFPASSPWVTGVGGTNFMLDASNAIVSQDVWNDAPIQTSAGGGGASILFSRPSYQNGFDPSRWRAVPDVSMLADPAPGYEIFCSAQPDCINGGNGNPWTQVGGTSAAAPLMAGGLALVDQELRLGGRQDIGLANPLLYKIASSSQAASTISDVTTGDNDLGLWIDNQPSGCCSAAAGYDEASGLGSIDLQGLEQVAIATVPKIVLVGLRVPGGQRRPVAREHLLARVSCTGSCLFGAYTALRIGHARKQIVQFSKVFLLRHQGARTIKIPFDHKTLVKLRAAVAGHQQITATIFGAILDPGGNVERQTVGKKLRFSH
jgi:subtilase family serine protease